MYCEHLEDHVCRSLPDDLARRFEEHLEHCSSCREAVDRETALFDTIARAVNTLEPGPEMGALRPTRSASRSSRYVGVVTAVCTAALVGVVAFFVLSDKAETVPKEQAQVASQSGIVRPPKIELPDGVEGIAIASSDPNIQIILINGSEPDSELLTP